MKESFEDFIRKNQQFFMNDFLHSKFPKMRWICGMCRAVIDFDMGALSETIFDHL